MTIYCALPGLFSAAIYGLLHTTQHSVPGQKDEQHFNDAYIYACLRLASYDIVHVLLRTSSMADSLQRGLARANLSSLESQFARR